MPIEQALLARARPHMLAERTRSLLQHEITKGCQPEISPVPVALEPDFTPIAELSQRAAAGPPAPWVPEPAPPLAELVRLRLWVSPQQKCDWLRSELFVKQLSHAGHRLAFEIIGNHDQVGLYLLCHRDDATVVRAAFRGQFELSEIAAAQVDPLATPPDTEWPDLAFGEWFPPPPYSHLLTRPDELKRSPFTTLLTALAELPAPALGIYQVVFAPVDPAHNWHQNVEALLDMEYGAKLWSGVADPGRYLQQAPSAQLNMMAGNVEYKAHRDKPFYTAVLRVGVLHGGELAPQLLPGLAVVAALIQHGGRPLACLREDQYRQRVSETGIQAMFQRGLTHRPGFLVNSWELVSLVHLAPPPTIQHTPMAWLEPLPPAPEVQHGTPVGVCSYAGRSMPVCIPEDQRCKHLHLVGRPGQGKSTVIEHMLLHDLDVGQGALVLDPHGRLVQRLMHLIPRRHAERVIYFNPGDPDWVPLWNPIQPVRGQDLGRTAEDLVLAFKKIVTSWGDRLETLLRQTFFAALNIPGSTLLDVSSMLHNQTKESDMIRAEVLRVIDNATARRFWLEDYKRYRKDDLSPPKNKLGKLLMSGTVHLMLSQPESALNFRDVMEQGRVILADLSQVGAQVCELLGCFMLELMRLTALTREGLDPAALPPFHIYCDEAHRFLTDAVEGLLAETRKYNVSLTLAHQYMSQFNTHQAGALASVGSSVIFNVDTQDANFLRKDLQDLVELNDLITQPVGHAVARIGVNIVRVQTRDALKIRPDHCRDLIVANSRQRYCRPIADVRRLVQERSRRWFPTAPDGDTHAAPRAADAAGSGGSGPAPGRVDPPGPPDIGHDVF
jgi:hypothetical protein